MSEKDVLKIVHDLEEAANTGRADEVLRVLKNADPNVPIPSDTLRGITHKMNVAQPDSSVTLLYSGKLGGVDGTPNAWEFAQRIGETTNGKVAVIDNTEAFKLLMNKDYSRFLELAAARENLDYAELTDQLWRRTSARLVIENPHPIMTLSPFPLDKSVYAGTELPASLLFSKAPTIEGIDRLSLLTNATDAMDISGVKGAVSVLSAKNAGDLSYFYDENNFLHLDTHKFWGDSFPEIPRTSLPAEATPNVLSSVISNAPPDKLASLSRGADTLDGLAHTSEALAERALDIRKTKWLAEAMEQGKKGVIITLATTAVGLALTQSAIAAQREMADYAHSLPPDNPKHMNDAQYADYMAMMNDMEPRMLAQAADPFFVTSTAQTVVLENDLHKQYQTFIQKYPMIDSTLADSLQPGMFGTSTLTQTVKERVTDLFEDMKNNPQSVPEHMRPLATAVQEADAAEKKLFISSINLGLSSGGMGMMMVPPASLIEDAAKAQEDYKAKVTILDQRFADALQSPDGIHYMLSQFDKRELLDTVSEISRYDAAPNKHPAVEALAAHLRTDPELRDHNKLNCHPWVFEKNSECKAFDAKTAELAAPLLRDPEIMVDYLGNKFIPPENRITNAQDLSPYQTARLEKTQGYIVMASALENMRAGIENDPVQIAEMKAAIQRGAESGTGQTQGLALLLAQDKFPQEAAQVTAQMREEKEAELFRLRYEEAQRNAALQRLLNPTAGAAGQQSGNAPWATPAEPSLAAPAMR